MSLQTVVLIVLGIILLGACAIGAGVGVWLYVRSRESKLKQAEAERDAAEKTYASSMALQAAVAEIQKSMAALVHVTREAAECTKDLPALEKGLIRVSQEQVTVLTGLREEMKTFQAAVTKLYESLFAKNPQAYMDYDEQQQSRAFRVQELVEKGIPELEAESRVATERTYNRNTLGV